MNDCRSRAWVSYYAYQMLYTVAAEGDSLDSYVQHYAIAMAERLRLDLIVRRRLGCLQRLTMQYL